jgi:hypothetical protein
MSGQGGGASGRPGKAKPAASVARSLPASFAHGRKRAVDRGADRLGQPPAGGVASKLASTVTSTTASSPLARP